MARPVASGRHARRTTDAPRAVVGRFRDEGSFALELDVRTAFDFVLSLQVGPDRDEELLADDRRWLAESRTRVGDAVAERLIFGSGAEHGLVAELSSLIADRPAVRTAADVVRLVDETSDEDIVRALLCDLLEDGVVGAILERFLAGDEAALPELEASWSAAKHEHPVPDLLRRTTQIVGRLREGLQAWLEPYQAIEDRVGRILERDAASRRVDLAAGPAAQAIERTTGGLRWLPEARVTRVILAPAYFGRPYNWLYASDGWRLIVYPVSDESLDEGDRFAPPQAAVRLYRALGDDTRLRILRLLVDRDLYLTELAQHLELSKPTVKHHLTQLRTAGLVTITEEGGLTYYSLRRSRAEEAGPELRRFLGL